MSPYRATHVPYGLTDPSKRLIYNPGVKDGAHFKKFGIETGGEYMEIETVVQGGGEVPLHRHETYGETFYPDVSLLGVVGQNGTKTMVLRKEHKETYEVKPGEWHRFFNASLTEELRFVGRVEPAHQGFEKLLYIYYGLVRDGFGTPEGAPKSLFHALMLINMGQVGYPGVAGWIGGVLASVVGWIARLVGEEERLTRKYYGRPITAEEKVKWKVA